MAKIVSIKAREILDSRGVPTIESKVVLENGSLGWSSVPSGIGIVEYQALQLRDNDASRYQGKGVLKAVDIVNTIIAQKIIGMDSSQQGVIDKTLIEIDGTERKSKLGANSMLSVSFAVCKAEAWSRKIALFKHINQLMKVALPNVNVHIPIPIFNIINGGKHGAGNLDFQEYHVVPATSKAYNEGLKMGVDVYQALKQVLIARNAVYSIGDEGGFAPNLYTNIDALEALTEAVKKTQYKLGIDAFLGLDIASSHIKTNQGYKIKDRPTALKANEFVDYLKDLNRDYHLLILEDPVDEKSWSEWSMMTEELRQSLVIVGDDLLGSNTKRLKRAIEDKACSAILIKPDQIGTLSETLQLIQIARNGGFKVIISHRSGETNDDFIADLSVAVAAEYVKFGAPVRGERVAKYNRLLEIYEEMKQGS